MIRGMVMDGSTQAETTELLRSSQDTQALSLVQNMQTGGGGGGVFLNRL